MRKCISLAVLAALSAGAAVAADRLPVNKPVPAIGSPTHATAPAGTPKMQADITENKQGIIIGGGIGGAGGQFVPWGGFADLSGVAPLPGTAGSGKCAFNATYFEVNKGTAVTAPLYTNKLRVDGGEVAINGGRKLNAGEAKSVTTQPYLSEGAHALTLVLDDGNLVPESNEGNNQFSIKYSLKCKAGEGQGKKPDLVPVLTNPMSGTVAVKNIGVGDAGPSKLVLTCKKTVMTTAAGGKCADIPAKDEAAYKDPAFPDAVTVKVPALAAGASFSHTFPFWGALVWSSGNYQITGKADAANAVAESNEGNNTAVSSLAVP
jgi:hypothetical protein